MWAHACRSVHGKNTHRSIFRSCFSSPTVGSWDQTWVVRLGGSIPLPMEPPLWPQEWASPFIVYIDHFSPCFPLCQRDNLWRWCSIMAVNSNIPSPGKGLGRLCCVPVIEKPLWIHHTAACWRLCVEIKLGDLTTSRREGTVCSDWKNPVLPVISSQSQMLLDSLSGRQFAK